MAKKVAENHKIVETAEEKSPAEELIEQQNGATAEFEFGDDEEDPEETPEPPTEAPEPSSEEKPAKAEETQGQVAVTKEKECFVILTGAASYSGCGMHFLKGQPTRVCKEVFDKLISTKLFAGV